MRRTSLLSSTLLVVLALAPQASSPATAAGAGPVLVFFSANDGIHGHELWKSDGTEVGTIMVRDIRSGEKGSNPALFAVIQGRVFFAANDGRHGLRMWVSDGTADGTKLLKGSPPPLSENWSGGGSAVVRGSLYFTTLRRYRIWRADGTMTGTFPLGIEGRCIASAGRTVFFVHNATSEVWRTDGTREGTFMLQHLRRPSALFACPGFTDVKGTMFYEGRDVRHGYEPWKSDGTLGGTRLVQDIEPGPDSSHPSMLGSAGNQAFFVTAALWRTDGTKAGTVRLHRFRHWVGVLGGSPVLNGRFFFYTSAGGLGAEPWKSDGTVDGTAMVKDIDPGGADSNPIGSAVLNGALFFTADDGIHGEELWRTDGTETGTSIVKDINPGEGVSFPDHLVSSGGFLFFGANDGVHGFELWKSDGTEAGTVMVKDINPSTSASNVLLTYLCASPSADACHRLR
jgi:ELWxxDGT repeat protein